MGFIESILTGALTKALVKFGNKILEFGKEFWRVKILGERGQAHVDETDKRVAKLEDLQLVAAEEIKQSTVVDVETGDILQEGKVSNETREALRQAGRDLIRGKRKSGRS